MVVETDFVRMQQVDKGLSRRRRNGETDKGEAQKKRRLAAQNGDGSLSATGKTPAPGSATSTSASQPANPWGPIFRNAEHFREMHIC